jgi:hypothetical protein
MRNGTFNRRLADAARHLAADVIEMRGFAAQDDSQTDDCVEAAGPGGTACCHWYFKGARNANDFNVARWRAHARQTIKAALEQPLGDELIKTANYHREAEPSRTQLTCADARR